MANAGNGSHGTDGNQQSIGSDTDQPIDGIEGSNPGTQQAAGQHVNAGGVGKTAARQWRKRRGQHCYASCWPTPQCYLSVIWTNHLE